MCDGASAAYAALAIVTAASAYATHEQGVRNAERQMRFTAEEQAQRESDARFAQQQAVENQTAQISERALEAQRELAFLQTAANEYGGGNSADRLLTIAGDDANRDIATIRSNTNRDLTQLSRASAADLAAYRSRIDILRANAPSRTGTLLKIGSSAVGAYSAGSARQPKTTGG